MTEPVNQLVDYLIDKINKVNLNNSRANSGAVTLRSTTNWKAALKESVHNTIDVLSASLSLIHI